MRRVYGLALGLVAVIFMFHAGMLFEIARNLIAVEAWLTNRYGSANAGRIAILVSFLALFVTHVVEAAAWGLLLWRKGLTEKFTDGVYFSTSSITSLGYGDVVLPPPWRMIGPVIAVSGTLMFGCSTAFLFLVLQKVWMQRV